MATRREYGPWTDPVFNTTVAVATGQSANDYIGWPRNWLTTTQGLPDYKETRPGLYRLRTGYHSPSGLRNIPRPASLTRTEHVQWPSSKTSTYSPWYLDTRNVMTNLGNILTASTGALSASEKSRVDSDSRTKFQKRAASDLKSLQILAEARKTGGMIASRAEKLAAGLIDRYQKPNLMRYVVGSGRTPSSTSVINKLGNYWLEFVYGYSPLINDIAMLCVALDDIEALRKSRVSGRSITNRSYTSVTYNWGSVEGYIVGNTPFISTLKLEVVESYESAYGATYMPSPGVSFGELVSGSWADIAPAAYELIPYSFVVDYFSNLGDIVAAKSFDWTSWGRFWHTTFLERTVKFTSIPQQSGAYKIITSTPGGGRITSINFNRTLDSGGTIPNFELSLPSLSQSANLIALVAARVRRNVPQAWRQNANGSLSLM